VIVIASWRDRFWYCWYRVLGTVREGLELLVPHRDPARGEVTLDEVARAYDATMPA